MLIINLQLTHEQASLLLPWYVNNTLGHTEQVQVANHLKTCSACNREIITLQNISLAVNTEFNTFSAPSLAFEGLKKRIHSSQSQNLTVLAPRSKPKKSQFSLSSREYVKKALPILALAAATSFALVLPNYTPLQLSLMNDYRTLSEGMQNSQLKNTVRIIFKENVSVATITETIADVQGVILAGPDAQSMYTIGFNNTHSSEELSKKLSSLKTNQQIIFAEPSLDWVSNLMAVSSNQ